MNKKIKLVSVLFFLSVFGVYAQTPSITITWTELRMEDGLSEAAYLAKLSEIKNAGKNMIV